MANDDKPRASRAASRAGPADETGEAARKGSSPERPFDMWLQKQLHAMYDEIASEPLPGDLLNLIDRDAAKSDAAAVGEEAVGRATAPRAAPQESQVERALSLDVRGQRPPAGRRILKQGESMPVASVAPKKAR